MKISQKTYKTIVYITDFLNNTFEYFYSSFKHLIKPVLKIKDNLYNCYINWIVNKNITITKNIGINSNTSMIKKVLIGRERKNVMEQTCATYLLYRLDVLVQKVCLL